MSSRTLHFPSGPTSAKLTMFAREPEPRRETAEARGAVDVFEGAGVWLQIGPDELETLSMLKPGDLRYLIVKDPAPGLREAMSRLGRIGLSPRGNLPPGLVAELAGLDQLFDLTTDAKLDAHSIAALAEMSQLQSLSLDGGASEAAAEAACRLTGLTRLVLTGGAEFAAGLDAVGDLTALETLVLHSPDLDDSVFPRLANLRELKVLSLRGAGICGDGIEVLADLPRLERLTISGPGVDTKALDRLKGCRSLTTLTLTGSPAIDDRAAPLLAELSPPLSQVRIGFTDGEEHPLSLSARVWLARSRPELDVNGFAPSGPAIERYLAAGLGLHPRTGGLELTP